MYLDTLYLLRNRYHAKLENIFVSFYIYQKFRNHLQIKFIRICDYKRTFKTFFE